MVCYGGSNNNIVLDPAAMAKREMLQWDTWGMMCDHGKSHSVPDGDTALLDEVSEALADPGVEPRMVRELAGKEGLAVPEKVTSHDPNGGPTRVDVDVKRVLGEV